MKFYAVQIKFANVEDIYSFDTKAERDAYVEASSKYERKSLTHKELVKRLCANRNEEKYMRQGLPTTFEDVEVFHSFDN